ncbi:uncharacterized protein LOC120291687 [Eucalyptus grandis]|uniref:uncharacterized protein LOC120291687 n=1 Tax=Eucalyptus grandis TaxID=71139 RepID=UPI00192EC815|nr:uncharacterized protein LOC120291687 [Eucalyptus grandis]
METSTESAYQLVSAQDLPTENAKPNEGYFGRDIIAGAAVRIASAGFFFFRIPDPEFRRKILEEGHITVARVALVLQQWKPLLELKREKQTSVPVWIRLKNLPLDLWTAPAISAIASTIGKPLFVDQRTEQSQRISFARVCVEIQVNKPRFYLTGVRLNGVVRSIAIEYEWKPAECLKCGSFGHNCATSLNGRKAVQGQKQVQTIPPPPPVEARPSETSPMLVVDLNEADFGWKQVKGKKNKSPPPKETYLDHPASSEKRNHLSSGRSSS